MISAAATIVLIFSCTTSVHARPTSNSEIDRLKKKLGVEAVSIADKQALGRTFDRLAGIKTSGDQVRILHLGDSHIAADLISGVIRERLQARFGDAGRGFMHVDHRKKFGGRVKSRPEGPWKKARHVEIHKERHPFGFSAISLTSKKKNARITYSIEAKEDLVRVYYQRHPKGGALDIIAGKTTLATIDTKGADESLIHDVKLPAKTKTIDLVATGPGVKLYGISFERQAPGLLYEPIGPVGADAKLYLQFGRDSFEQHIKAHKPDLFILMVGGNDTLKIRKGWTTLDNVHKDHADLLALLKKIRPEADCMVWSPMDAGEKKGGKVVSKDKIVEMRALQEKVAASHGCAFWDMHKLMGGEGSIALWAKAGVMNRDLIHPKQKAADLLGHMFSDAFLEAFDAR